MQMIFGGWMGASSLASSMGTRSGGIESGMIEPHGSLARGGVPSREEMTSPFSVVSTRPWCTRFDNWKRQYFIRKPIYRRGRGERREIGNDAFPIQESAARTGTCAPTQSKHYFFTALVI